MNDRPTKDYPLANVLNHKPPVARAYQIAIWTVIIFWLGVSLWVLR